MEKGRDQVVDDSLNLILVVGGEPEHNPLFLVPVPLPKVKVKERASPTTDVTKANPIAQTPVTATHTKALKQNPKRPVDIAVAIILHATAGKGRMRQRRMG